MLNRGIAQLVSVLGSEPRSRQFDPAYPDEIQIGDLAQLVRALPLKKEDVVSSNLTFTAYAWSLFMGIFNAPCNFKSMPGIDYTALCFVMSGFFIKLLLLFSL